MDDLTPRELHAYEWIQRFMAQHGRSPKKWEMVNGFAKKSSPMAYKILDRLEALGYITKTLRSQNVRLTNKRYIYKKPEEDK